MTTTATPPPSCDGRCYVDSDRCQCVAAQQPADEATLRMRGPQPMPDDHAPAAAVAVPLDAPVGRQGPERAELRKTTLRMAGLAALAGGKATHPGSQGLCYTLERAGVVEWNKSDNRYRLTAKGIETLAHWMTPNHPLQASRYGFACSVESGPRNTR